MFKFLGDAIKKGWKDLNDAYRDMQFKKAFEKMCSNPAKKEKALKKIRGYMQKGACLKNEDISARYLRELVKDNHNDVIDYLIEKNICDETQSVFSIALTDAVKKGNKDRVQKLLKAGVNVNAVEVRFLMLSPEDKTAAVSSDTYGKSALMCAVENNDLDMVKFLVKEKADVNSGNELDFTPLIAAVAKNNLEMVDVLLNAKCDVNRNSRYGDTAVTTAIDKDNILILKRLLKEKVNLNARKDGDLTPLMYAISHDALKCAEALAQTKQFLDETGATNCSALTLAVEKNNLDMVETLIKSGCDVNAFAGSDRTALYTAVKRNHVKIVKKLLEAGADPNKTTDAYTPLYDIVARKGGSLEIMHDLLKAGADSNIQDPVSGKSLLHYAVCNNEVGVVKLLLDNGAKPDALDNDGNTPLMAAFAGNVVSDKIVELLFQKHARLDIKNNDGKTAMDMYQEHFARYQAYKNVNNLLGLNDNGESSAKETPSRTMGKKKSAMPKNTSNTGGMSL